ncbi:RseC/MucC family positive regulator of sigma(E) [Paludibacter sp. 221]|uniref:SoxR reducing system RseC family protein n=1 Tax=Paludibacter sp. 221 TaxID=2302939 RepID=UPI0013D38082|nr:SoxR reducing system RseC family protein [Paludibacter sp. 221]NDV46545.1 RseC/MucC family positive regulator of sigma(E) [Paludibacter sp. 221]
MSQIIEHTGKILTINGDTAKVLITQNSACSGCHAKSACTAADSAEKIIDAININNISLKAGDDVIIYGKRSVGLKAVLLAFVIPFLLILVSLFVLRAFIDNEAVSGTIALATLIPYYIILSLFRDKLKSDFQFYVKTSSDT